MKHLKAYENNSKTFKLNKFLIHIPSQEYFKSPYKFYVIFVDFYERNVTESMTNYVLHYDFIIKYDHDNRMSFENQKKTWNYIYDEESFDELEFMTAKELYKAHDYLVEDVIKNTLEKLKDNRLRTNFDFYNKVLDLLTIPETEHLIQADKYNL